MAAAPVVIAAMEPAQSALTSRKSWLKIRCYEYSPSQDLEAFAGKEIQNRANNAKSVCYQYHSKNTMTYNNSVVMLGICSFHASLDRTSSTVLEEVFQDVRGLNKNVKATINETKLGSTDKKAVLSVIQSLQ